MRNECRLQAALVRSVPCVEGGRRADFLMAVADGEHG